MKNNFLFTLMFIIIILQNFCCHNVFFVVVLMMAISYTIKIIIACFFRKFYATSAILTRVIDSSDSNDEMNSVPVIFE